MKKILFLAVISSILVTGLTIQAAAQEFVELRKGDRTVQFYADMQVERGVFLRRNAILAEAKAKDALLIVRDRCDFDHWVGSMHPSIVNLNELKSAAIRNPLVNSYIGSLLVTFAKKEGLKITNLCIASRLLCPLSTLNYIKKFIERAHRASPLHSEACVSMLAVLEEPLQNNLQSVSQLDEPTKERLWKLVLEYEKISAFYLLLTTHEKNAIVLLDTDDLCFITSSLKDQEWNVVQEAAAPVLSSSSSSSNQALGDDQKELLKAPCSDSSSSDVSSPSNEQTTVAACEIEVMPLPPLEATAPLIISNADSSIISESTDSLSMQQNSSAWFKRRSVRVAAGLTCAAGLCAVIAYKIGLTARLWNWISGKA